MRVHVDQPGQQRVAGRAHDGVCVTRLDLSSAAHGFDTTVFAYDQRLPWLSVSTGSVDQPFGKNYRLHVNYTFKRGSSASRKPSPSMFSESTVSMIASPGNVAIHHCSRRYWRPSLSMRPHS